MMTEGKPEKKVKDQVQIPHRIEGPQHYGMHRHFTGAGSILMVRRRHQERIRLWRNRR